MSDNNFYWASGYTGGTDGALDAIDGAALNDGDVAMVTNSSGSKMYVLDAASGLSGLFDRIIPPVSNAGTKRWIYNGAITDPLAISNTNPIFDMPMIHDLSFKGSGAETFTRSTTGTYIDRYGVLKTAAINVARHEKEGALFECSITNQFLQSDTFTDSVWAKYGSTATLSGSVLGPDGVTYAHELMDGSSTATHRISQVVTPTATGSITISFMVKAGTKTKYRITVANSETIAQVYFDLSMGTVNSTSVGSGKIKKLADGYYRLIVTGSIASLDAVTAYLFMCNDSWATSYQGDGTGTGYIACAQFEAMPFATSYFPSGSTAGVRGADFLDVGWEGNVPLWTDEYSIEVDFDIMGYYNSGAIVVRIYGETSRMIQATSSGLLVARAVFGGDTFLKEIEADQTYHICFSSSPSRQVVSLDGEVFGYSTVEQSITGVPTSIRIGRGAGSATSTLCGHIKNLKIHDRALM